MKSTGYIPPLKYHWLTKLYDPLIQSTMPEKQFKGDLIKQANIQPNYDVLDFGCGSLTLSLMIRMSENRANVTAIDVDEKIIEIAKQKKQEFGTDIKIDHYHGKILPYEDDSFDRVLTSLVFHHLNKKQKENSLKEIYRVLKPGGELHIADWGKPNNIIMRLAFYGVQFLDGFKTTRDNVKGLLPEYIRNANFINVETRKSFNTIFGTLSLYKGLKSNHKKI